MPLFVLRASVINRWYLWFVCISSLLITNSAVSEVILPLVLYSSIQYRTSNAHKFYFMEK